MENNLKILVASPIYEGMDYCFGDFLEHIRRIEGFEFDFLFIDNSKTPEFSNKISEHKDLILIRDDTREEKNLLRLVSSRNKILDYAIENKYDYLLMMDSDVMVPSNILSKLLSEKKEVVSGLYFNLFNSNGKPKLLPVCYLEIEDNVFQEMKNQGMVPEFITSRSEIRRNLTTAEIEKGDVLEVLIPSAGCLLLSRKAFSSGAKYGVLENSQDLITTDDIFFFKELRDKGFKLYCDPSVYCKHAALNKYNGNKGSHPIYD
jgi:hypothetical protein